MQKLLLSLLSLAITLNMNAQVSPSGKIWQQINESQIQPVGKRFSFPTQYATYHLDKNEMQRFLSTAPMEQSATSRLTEAIIVEMPMPDGSFQKFKIVEYNVLHPNLAALFPEIKTYTGQGIDDPSAVIKLDMTSLGFHAMVLSPKGQIFIDPYSENTSTDYICYDKKNLPRSNPFNCEVTDETDRQQLSAQISNLPRSSGTQLRTYRLALACTGEYAATKGGTVSGALSGMATTMNRVNGVYETEVAIRMVIIANNNLIVYTNASTDPYTNNSGSTMLGQNASTLNSVIGSANFDIGHVFSTGGGGVATLNGPCGTNKARGVTGSSNPVGDAFDIDYVAHEMGHQFGGNHTFNSNVGSCSGNRNASTAYEPGSGVTIQGYAGICGTDNVLPNSIAYFHTISFDEIVIFSQTGSGNGCPVITNTGNTAPVVTTMGSTLSIPVSTPFVLTGAATDANGDPLTYSWEEFDLGAAGAWNVQSTTAPMFRSFTPTSSPSRTFPRLSDIINNTATVGELLPNQARTLKFRLTARDNRVGGGGVMHPDATLNISVVNNGGAFAVTAPNTAVTWAGNSTQTVTWSVNGTTNAPINTANVRILLSTDGGNSFPTELLATTPNDGSENILVPNISTTQARVKVEAIGNIFFDMSNSNFTITVSAGLTQITTSAVSPLSYCAGANVNVPFVVNAAASAGNVFTAQLSNASGSFASPANIGTLTSLTSGTIAGTIPANVIAGSGYRIRVISSAPAVTGTDNGSNLSILNAPAASAISASGSTTFCSGGSVILSGNSNGGTWSIGGSTASSITVTGSGNYFVTNTNSCGTVTSNQIIVTVNPLPIVTAANVTGCAGTPITLSGSSAGGTFSVSNPYNGPTTSYTYTYTNVNGCTATSPPASITVNPLPVVNAGTYAAVTSTSPAFTLNGTPAGGSFSGPGVSGNSFNPSVTGVGTFTLIYTYTNANNCTASSSTQVTVNPPACVYSVGAITGPANACAFMGPGDGNATYTISATGASGYTWVAPANASIVSGQGTNTIVVDYSPTFTSGYLNVTVGNSCGGTSSLVKLSVKTTLPLTPGGITGPVNACVYFGGNAATYTIRKVLNSSFYQWAVPAGATILSHPGGTDVNDTIITVTYDNSFVSGTGISVRAGSFCGLSSAVRTLTISRTNPSVPGVMTGPTDVCPFAGNGVQATYTIRSQANASSYNWVVPANASIAANPGGTGTRNDTIIKVLFNAGFTGGSISVSAVNGCFTSTPRLLAVSKKLAAVPAKIYGDPSGSQGPLTPAPLDACPYIFSGTDAVYSINKVKVITDPSGYASGYNWILTNPLNSSIVSHPAGSGANDTIIVVRFAPGYTTGAVQVQSLRSCGTSAARSVTVTKLVPATPAVINGPTSPCPSTIETYTVNAVNATTYNWTFPSTVSIISGAGTNTVQLQFSAAFNGGTIRVSTTSACGTSAARSLGTTRCATFTRQTAADELEAGLNESLIFPNPSDGNFRINLKTGKNNSMANIIIMNEFGQTVYQTITRVNNGLIEMNLREKFTNGIYFLSCTVDERKIVKKIFISK